MEVDEATKEIKISLIEIINVLYEKGITLGDIFDHWPDDQQTDEFVYDLRKKKLFEGMEE